MNNEEDTEIVAHLPGGIDLRQQRTNHGADGKFTGGSSGGGGHKAMKGAKHKGTANKALALAGSHDKQAKSETHHAIEKYDVPSGHGPFGTHGTVDKSKTHTLTHHDKAAHAASADAARASHKAYSTGSSADHAHAHQAHVHAEAMHNKAAEHATHPQMKFHHEGWASVARADQMGHARFK